MPASELGLASKYDENRPGTRVDGIALPVEQDRVVIILVVDGVPMLLGVARRATHPVRDSLGRPGAAVEVLADGHGVGNEVGRLHRRERADVRHHRHRLRPVDRRQSNDKKRARINAMRYFLAQSDYDAKDDEVVGEPDPLIVDGR